MSATTKSSHETKSTTKVEQEEYILVLLSSAPSHNGVAYKDVTNKISDGANMFLVPAIMIDAASRKLLKKLRETGRSLEDEEEEQWEAMLEMFQPYYVKPQFGGKSNFGSPRLVVDSIYGYYY